ncbi:TPA: YonK family protein [Clostridium botulinum]|nr:YonK family protein [Clostridium botulinum]
MAKENKTLKFSNACITKDNGIYIITETTKDEEKVYNLSEKLDEFLEIEGISLQMAKTSELPSEE